MEHGLSACSDDITSLQNNMRALEKTVESLQEKCLDLQGRMTRSNIWILNVPEEHGSSWPASVSNLIKESLKLDKDWVIDRNH